MVGNGGNDIIETNEGRSSFADAEQVLAIEASIDENGSKSCGSLCISLSVVFSVLGLLCIVALGLMVYRSRGVRSEDAHEETMRNDDAVDA